MARWATSVAVAAAADAARIPLDVWAFGSRNGSLRIGNASVPGTAHTHLMAAGVIDDPYFRYNELEYRWVAEETWVYEAGVTLDESPAHTKLVFEGLDGPAEVIVNGRTLAHTANSFRSYEFDVTNVLAPEGTENKIAVVFSPATQYARDAVRSQVLMLVWLVCSDC